MAITRFKGLWGNANSLGNPTVAIDSGVLQMDGSITIGQLPIPLADFAVLSNATLTDNNAGQANAPDISINVAAATTAVIPFAVSEYFKEVQSFLSPTSVPPINNSGFLADDSGDSWPLKGSKPTSFTLIYQVIGVGLTSLNFRCDLITFAAAGSTNVALYANTAQAAGALVVTGAAGIANPMALLTIPLTTQAFDVSAASEMYIKISPVTPGGSTFRLYGVMMNMSYNYL